MELFKTFNKIQPLAWRMQPDNLDDFLGQQHLLDKNKPLRRLIEEDRIVSLILYGPPGTGKTALARVIAGLTNAQFIQINAVISGVKDIRDAISSARHGKTILFIDEIHRFNKAQQDALLPSVESGEIVLIGASTQNPFFALVPALSSRSVIFRFNPIEKDNIKILLHRALSDKKGLGSYNISIGDEVLDYIASFSNGDARRALNLLELAFLSSHADEGVHRISLTHVKEAVQDRTIYYDSEEHYNTISAFIKSMRGSDPDATVYWLARMLESGEDPLFIARRIAICASEDVGNADPFAVVLATSVMNAIEKIGMPEGRILLSHAAIYVATAPKSNASYLAIDRAIEYIQNHELQKVPEHLKDTHYKGAERLGAGKGYLYPHDFKGHYIKQKYMTEEVAFYIPTEEGQEKNIKSRLQKRGASSDV